MMPSVLSDLLRRPAGKGWLVLTGGPVPEDLIHRALALVGQAGSLAAVVPAASDLQKAESQLRGWTDASGWSGRVADCESPAVLEDVLLEAALILLPELSGSEAYLRALETTDAGEYLLAALDAGVVVVAEGQAAEAMGAYIGPAVTTDSVVPALGWLPGVVLQAHFTDQIPFPFAGKRKNLFRIGLPEGVAIAMGPDGEREIWGEGQPTITFRDWWKTS
jgi:hypothetical protein